MISSMSTVSLEVNSVVYKSTVTVAALAFYSPGTSVAGDCAMTSQKFPTAAGPARHLGTTQDRRPVPPILRQDY